MSYDRTDNFEREAPRTARYHCGGPGSYNGSCGATDCGTCYPGGCWDEDESESEEDEDKEHTTYTTKIVTVRKARVDCQHRQILVGDKAMVTTGFTYVKGGPRCYFRTYHLWSRGPAAR